MQWPTVILVYVILWWLSFFVVLPFGNVSQQEAGEVEPGTIASAPSVFNWKKKVLITSILAAFLTLITFFIVSTDLFNIRPD